ncbi:MAG: T9SS type A sorting domain-containing protein [Candidatus Stahlbacteria bacterium]|nr:MAG: T9SS type A sorting domain-containing protein [Candidatus Stahlbacteria bacterium]
MFGCAYMGDGSSSGNVQTVTGQSGTFVSGMDYNYLYQQGPDSYVDYISAVNGTIFFKSQDNQGRAVNYNGPAGEYRAIHSTFIFGALRNETYNKNELMEIYVDYLGSTIAIEELTDNCIYDVSVFPNPASDNVNFHFTLLHAGKVNIKIYNTAGQLVRRLIDEELTQNSHRIIWNSEDDAGRTVSSGCYIVKIKTDVETINKVIILVK